MISDGCIISGAKISNSLLHTNVVANEGTTIDESVVLPDVVIGEHCTIKRAILDRRCVIPSGTTIGYDEGLDARRFHVSPTGIVLVTPKMLSDMEEDMFRIAA